MCTIAPPVWTRSRCDDCLPGQAGVDTATQTRLRGARVLFRFSLKSVSSGASMSELARDEVEITLAENA
jgi:hypothetical protein